MKKVTEVYPFTWYVGGRHIHEDTELKTFHMEGGGMLGRPSLGSDFGGGWNLLDELNRLGVPLGSKVRVTMEVVDDG